MVRWLISSDEGDDDDDEEVMELAGPSSFRDGCWSSWVVMGATAGEPAGDGTTDGGDDPGDVNWNRLTAAAAVVAVDGWLLLLLLVDSDDNKHDVDDDDADADADGDDDDDCVILAGDGVVDITDCTDVNILFQLIFTRLRGGPIGGICCVARARNASFIRCGCVVTMFFQPTVSITSVA